MKSTKRKQTGAGYEHHSPASESGTRVALYQDIPPHLTHE